MARTANKRKTNDASFLSSLQMLREVLGSTVQESDLSACLRQCGCNVELAAERLMTGQFTQKKSSAVTMESLTNKRQRIAPATVSPKTPTVASLKKNTPPTLSAGSKAPSTDMTPPTGHHLWLCQRWVVGLSTTKHGRIRYKESLEMTHSLTGPPMVRFRGKGVQGTLRANVAALLVPLLRNETPMISLEAEALMDEQGIPMGGDVPMALRIFVQDPVAFFDLFENMTPEGSARSQFFGKDRPRRKGLFIAEAAFALLQWAEYGDDPTFEPPTNEDESKDCSDEEVEVMGEDDFEAEGEDKQDSPEWAKNVVDEGMRLPEACDPLGFKGNVVLRPYQRQALHWMLKRESGSDNREELEQELTLLAELGRNASRLRPIEPTEQDIVCELGPVRVSPSMATKSRTIDGVENPVNHPLWQRRFLASPNKENVISFYVNELLSVASSKPPNPPRHCVGGILADAMGLGKTVMLLALILKDKELSDCNGSPGDKMDDDKVAEGWADKKQRRATTLVVAPLSLVSQWEEELMTKTGLTHRVYYADTAKGGIRPGSFDGVDVVVTTYGTVQGELLSSSKGNTKNSGLLTYDWHRVILDESHCIKNPSTVIARACCVLKADKRWCVTGTPIQNSLQDVYALLKFLRHEPWCEGGFWKAAITNAATETGEKDAAQSDNARGKSESTQNQETARRTVALSRVKRLLAPLILRRTKDTVNENGQPILTLPPVETTTVSVELSPAEREFYNSLMQKSQTVFEGFLKDGTASKSWFAIFSLLNRLRQACDHVALTVKSHMEDDDWNPARLHADADKKKQASPVATKAKKASNDKDALGDEFLEGLLEKFRTKQASDKENVELTYASQVAHALTKTIKSSSTTMEEECPICLDTPLIHEAVITPCAHIFCRDCLIGILKNAERNGSIQNSLQCPDGKCPSCNEMIDAKRIIMLSRSSEDCCVTTSYLTSSNNGKKSAVVKAELKQDSAHLVARQTLEKALCGAGSSKLTAVVNELNNVWEKDPRSKVLIFSQYLGFLDLLESSLRNKNIRCGRLDGKLSLKERVSVLEKFRNDTPMEPDDNIDEHTSRIGSVLLMSMKAGGVGINMVAASSVFIVDPWWNAAVEDQCVSRIHRIGQTAEVVRVRKFVVKESVEERIVLLQRRKKDMACEVLSDVNNDGALTNSAPTLEDFKLLFGS